MRGAGVSGRMEPHIPQPVLFAPVASLVERLLQAKRDLSLSRKLRKLDRISCLILDDIGYVQHDRAEAARKRSPKTPSDGRKSTKKAGSGGS